MNRPCTCDAVQLGTRWSPGQCRACWLFHHSLNKRLEWGGDGHVQAIPPLSTEEWENMQPQYRPALHCAWEKWQKHGKRHPQPRVGTQLKQLISWFNIKPEKGCQCESRAAAMDALGPGWCRENKKTILDWLELEATKRSLPFSRLIGEQFVNLAIHNAVEEFKRTPAHYDGYFGDWTSPEEYAKSFLDNGCPLWPHTFSKFANAQEGFRLAFTEACNRVPVMPQWQHEKGIAICGGGRKYFPGAYATIRIIREHGCDWPIELWHLGPQEREPEMDALLSKCGDVRWRDGLEVAANVGLRCGGGWELKAFALAYSDFEKVLLLDADCYPVHHPQELIDQDTTGAVFYPDTSDFYPKLYDWFGVPQHPDNISFESGQLYVDKRLHWKPTWLALWMNHNSAYVYKHVYGDKDTFLLAWLKAGHEFAMPSRKPDCHNGVFVHCDFQKRPFFVHRIHAKPHFPSWGKAMFSSDQRPISTAHLPRDAWVCAAIDTGETYVSRNLSTHEPWLAHTVPAGGKLALDIGANKGVWSAELARRFERVIAFEPQPSVASHLRHIPKAEVRQHAIWHEPATLTLHQRPGHHAQATVFDPTHWVEREHPTIDIPAVTLDSLNLAPDFIKIDTEGAEDNILRGGEQTIRTHRPAMLIECHGKERESECRALLESWGFAAVHIDNPITPLGSTWLWVPNTKLPPARLTIVRGAVGTEHNSMLAVGDDAWRQYAQERGYNYLTFHHPWTTRDAAWNKLLWIRAALEQTDGDVLWADADTLLSDPTQDLHDMIPAQGVAMGWYDQPAPHFNSGVMAIRNDHVSRDYLRAAWESGQFTDGAGRYEQPALNKHAQEYGVVALKDYWHGIFGPGVIRGFHGMPNRLAAMKEHLENNVQLLKNSV